MSLVETVSTVGSAVLLEPSPHHRGEAMHELM